MSWDASEIVWRPGAGLRLRGSVRRRGVPVAAARTDWELLPVNGVRLRAPGQVRPVPAGAIYAVSYRAELRPSTVEVLSHLADPQAALVSRHRITGGVRVAEFEAAGGDESARSLESATAAAAGLLGHVVTETGRGARVDAVREGTPGLRCGDIIIAADGEPVTTAHELAAALSDATEAELDVVRDGLPGRGPAEDVLLLRRRTGGTWGVRVSTEDRRLEHGVRVGFDLPGDLRGPSLGLACALSVVDAFTDGRLAAGGAVVATGVVDLQGRVSAVGAVKYKARTVRAHPRVRTFLLPAECGEDVADARRVLGDRVEVVPVATLDEAIRALRERESR